MSHSFLIGGIFTEWTNLVTAFKRKTLGLWTISKPFSCCDWYYKAVSKRYWNRKSQAIRGFTAVPLGSSGTLQSRRSPWNAVWLCKNSLSDNRRTVGGRKHLTTETVLFSSWGLWFLFLFRALCFRRHIRPLLPWTGQRSSGGIERSWVQTIWKLSSGTTKKLVWVLYGRFGGWRCDETPWPCH